MQVVSVLLTIVVILLIIIVVIGIAALIGTKIVWAWGKKCYGTPEEQAMTFPGDELMERFDPKYIETVTAGITIDAPVEDVYPWIYQWGGTKSGSLSSEFLERFFGRLSIFNRYELCDEWQMPDSFMPGDFMDWDRSGMGCEATDVVQDKYVMSFSDIQHPPRARGAYAIAGGKCDDMNFIWGWYFVPLKGGKTRFLCHWKYYGTKDPLTRFVLKRAIYCCGTAMQRWQMEYTDKCATGRMPVHRHVKKYRKIFGAYHYAPDEVQERTDCPHIREGRENPAVNEVRPARMADPAWPPKDSPWDVDEDYYRKRIPEAIKEIEEKAARQQADAQAKIDALKEELAALE
ncbi:MAG: hypothetical protein ACOX69_06215 [Coriobacteriales bacterium]